MVYPVGKLTLWLVLSMPLLTGCLPFAGWQMYEAVETQKKIRA